MVSLTLSPGPGKAGAGVSFTSAGLRLQAGLAQASDTDAEGRGAGKPLTRLHKIHAGRLGPGLGWGEGPKAGCHPTLHRVW